MTTQIDAWLEEGLRHYSQGDPARALEAWYRILDVDPGHSLTQQYVAYVRQVYHIDSPAQTAGTSVEAVTQDPGGEAATASAAPVEASIEASLEEALTPSAEEPAVAAVAASAVGVDTAVADQGVEPTTSYDDAIVDLSPPSSEQAPRTDRIDLEALAFVSAVVPESALAAAPQPTQQPTATLPPSFAPTSLPMPAPPEEPKRGLVGFDASADWSDLVESAFDVVAPKTGSRAVPLVARPATPPPAALASPPATAPPPGTSPESSSEAAAAAAPPAPSSESPSEAAPTLPRMSASNPWAPRRTSPPPQDRPASPASSETFQPPPDTPVLVDPVRTPVYESLAPVLSMPQAAAPPPTEAVLASPEASTAAAAPATSSDSFDPWIGDSVPSQVPVLSGPTRSAAADLLELPPPTPAPVEADVDLASLPGMSAWLQAAPAQLPLSEPNGGFDVDIDVADEEPASAAPLPSLSASPPPPQAAAPAAGEPRLAEVVPIWKRAAVEEVPHSARAGAAALEERVAATKPRYNDYSNYSGSSSPPVRASEVTAPQAPPPPAVDPWEEIDSIASTVDLDHAPSPSASLEQILAPKDRAGLAAWPTTPGSATPAASNEDECEALMRGARELFDLGDFSGSLDLVEKALSKNPNHDGARAYMQRNEATLLRMYESKLGDLSRTPRQLVPPDEVIWMNMHHKAGFILSQVDGMMTYDDLVSISGMSRFDTMRILHDLVQQRIIG